MYKALYQVGFHANIRSFITKGDSLLVVIFLLIILFTGKRTESVQRTTETRDEVIEARIRSHV